MTISFDDAYHSLHLPSISYPSLSLSVSLSSLYLFFINFLLFSHCLYFSRSHSMCDSFSEFFDTIIQALTNHFKLPLDNFFSPLSLYHWTKGRKFSFFLTDTINENYLFQWASLLPSLFPHLSVNPSLIISHVFPFFLSYSLSFSVFQERERESYVVSNDPSDSIWIQRNERL